MAEIKMGVVESHFADICELCKKVTLNTIMGSKTS